ncbi:sterol desaturase family protein [Parvularcula marina]|uniref:Sterol desaturase family protein n=1 Tax=Parvularcula marina TaxID=2292771 RepID=A0A371RJC9_9PROT|nr:sterol desaturase family protein [Parvularcula marina]RFB05557.1 sterol desaturase family protein [Parvularcula marina]
MEAPNLPDISSFAAPLYIGLILLEIALIAKFRARGAYETRDTVTSLLMGTGSVIVPLLLAGTAYAWLKALEHSLYDWRLFDLGFEWWAFVIAFVGYDFVYYWSHRFQHTIRWGWASHVIHHSSQHYNLSTALRQTWTGLFTGFFVLSIPLILLGLHPAVIAFAASLNLLYQFWIHTEVIDRFPRWFEAVMNTPSHHRVHHGKNPRYLDSNYAGVFIVWDRMFGTFIPEEKSDPVRYGLVKDIGTFNPFRVATHEYVAIWKDATQPGLTIGQRLRYLFAPPGWSHDGSRKTSKDIRAEAGFSKSGAEAPAPLHPAE